MYLQNRLFLLALSSEVKKATINSPRVPFVMPARTLAIEHAPSKELLEVHRPSVAGNTFAFRRIDRIHRNLRQDERDVRSDKGTRRKVTILPALLLALVAVSSSLAEVPKQARAAIDRIIGGEGTYITDEGVYKVLLPWEAATIVQDYQTLSPNIGLNSWVAFTPAVHHEALLTGQFLLLEDEVNPVLTAALGAGLEITGLADSSLFDGPRTEALDVTGLGKYQDLATAFRKVLDEIRRKRADASLQIAKLLASPTLTLDSSITPGPLGTC